MLIRTRADLVLSCRYENNIRTSGASGTIDDDKLINGGKLITCRSMREIDTDRANKRSRKKLGAVLKSFKTHELKHPSVTYFSFHLFN